MAVNPRPMSLVKLREGFFSAKEVVSLPFSDDFPLVFLGEIPNMAGHGVFSGSKTGKVYSGYHIDQFVELSEDEV
jgi:hypothetical protein